MTEINDLTTGIGKDKTEEILDRIVEIAHPSKIILFGSAVKGKATKDSDIDLLVIKDGDYHKGKLVGDIYMNLVGVGQAVDVVVVTPQEVERYRDSHPLVIKPAIEEGKVIYEREAQRTG